MESSSHKYKSPSEKGDQPRKRDKSIRINKKLREMASTPDSGLNKSRRLSKEELESKDSSDELEKEFKNEVSNFQKLGSFKKLHANVHLLSYLEKSKIKEDMRRLMNGRVLQLRTFIELDYFEFRSQIRHMLISQNIAEDTLNEHISKNMSLKIICQAVNVLDEILTSIKACDSEFPDLDLLETTCERYLICLSSTKPNVYYASEEQMKRYQDKVSLCKSMKFMVNVYKRNLVWKEYLEGCWSSDNG
jgi:hypothetical protein